MIKEIFLPVKTNGRRLISQRIVGITIHENSVSAVQAYATSSKTTVERVAEESIPPGVPSRYNERVSTVIQSILKSFARFDQIRVSIPSSIVTFKELSLPFVDKEKIEMVLEYEVEDKLPFSINEAVVDFIITDQNKKEKTSQVLVAAVRTEDLQKVFEIYTLAGIDPDCITVDLFALYGLYLQIPTYKNLSNASALIDIGSTSTSVAFLLNGQMRLTRTIAKGLTTIAQHISDDTETPIAQVLQNFISFGTEKPDDESYNLIAQKYLGAFLNDIQFTLNSFSLKLNFYGEVSMILFVGKGKQIKGFDQFSSRVLQIPCEYFSSQKLFKTKQITNKAKQLISTATNQILALATAIAYGPHDEFDLRKKEFEKTNFPLMKKQIVMGALLTLLIFATIGIRGFLQISELSALAARREQEAITQLKKIFPPRHKSLKKKNLRALFRDAKREVDERKEAWQPFLQENLQPLEILKDLTQTMDKRTFNITIEQITLSLDDKGSPLVDLTGQFAGQPGRHFGDFGEFKKYFEKTSKQLTLREGPEDDSSHGATPCSLLQKGV